MAVIVLFLMMFALFLMVLAFVLMVLAFVLIMPVLVLMMPVLVLMMPVLMVIIVHIEHAFLTSKGIQESLVLRRRPVELEPGLDQVLGIDRIGVIEPDAPGIGPPVLIPG